MQSFNPEFQNLQHSFSEMNQNMELLNHLSASENLLSSDLSNGSFLDHQQPPLPLTYTHNIQSSFLSHGPFCDPVTHFLPSAGGPSREGKSVKGISETDTFQISSPPPSGSGLVADKKTKRNYSFGGKKRKRSNEREVEKPREVIHVRAKRGQATDSHSLAERLRREKINEKLRCLQDLVPGCYKTMGMAVMLDVIISYVRSLQNQIDFLSMKLSAASLFYDFNSEVDATETMQGTNGYEAQGTERMGGEGFGGGFSYFPSTWPF